MKNGLVIVIAVLMLCLCGCGAAAPDGSEMRITCFDVGQADSFLVQCDGACMLIDTGTASDGITVAEELEKAGVSTIDYLMITHFDKDHVGGAARILREFQVSEVLRPAYMKESDEVTAYIQTMEEKTGEVEETILSEVLSLQLGSASVVIHPAARELYEKDPSNNSSLVTEIFHEGNSLLFTGDVEKERIKELLEEEFAWGYDFVKAPHHGKYEKILKKYFKKIDAESCVITCSNKNPEEAETLDLLDDIKTEYYLTKNGPVQICSGRTGIRIEQ